MIVAQQKSLDEIRQLIEPYQSILITGCGTCMTVCNAGGEREVAFLRQALELAESRNNELKHSFGEITVKRQCDREFLEPLDQKTGEFDAILSLGCGIGSQAIAERFPDIPVIPGVNTCFMGMTNEFGVWDERCGACGDCRLAETGGICPITRCTKGILNGPCAGSKNGKCEANKEIDCAWVLIYKRLENMQQLDKMRRFYPARNFRVIARPKRITGMIQINAGDNNA